MHNASRSSDQHFPSLLDATSADVRCAMDAAEIAHAWAGRLLDTMSLTRRQQQSLYDIRREQRRDAINRSPFGLLFELAPFAPFHAAIYGPALFKVEIVGRAEYPMLSEAAANDAEERTNYDGNMAQYRRKERKTRSTAFDVVDTMNAQAHASEQFALSVALGR